MDETVNPASPDATPPAQEPAATPAQPRRKTSRALRDAQRWERRFSKAAHRIAKATERGIATYREERDRSSFAKRDGALRDLSVNVAEGMGAALREASRVPADLAKGLDGRRVLRAVRRGMRLWIRPFVR
ncbi:MAG: hypothetical protein ACM3OB_07355 [Acidobacteriota bacterium]